MADSDEIDMTQLPLLSTPERTLLALGYYEALGNDDELMRTYLTTYGHAYLSVSFVALVGGMMMAIQADQPERYPNGVANWVRQQLAGMA